MGHGKEEEKGPVSHQQPESGEGSGPGATLEEVLEKMREAAGSEEELPGEEETEGEYPTVLTHNNCGGRIICRIVPQASFYRSYMIGGVSGSGRRHVEYYCGECLATLDTVRVEDLLRARSEK